MSKFKAAFAFLLGAACGGGAVWYFLRENYERQAEADISSAKEAFHTREAKLKEQIVELQAQLAPEVTIDAQAVLNVAKAPEKGDISEYADLRSKYQRYSEQVAAPRPEPEEPKADSIEAPYVIEPDEFGELEGYEQVSLTYYADGILADEHGVIIDDVEGIVGDALDHFGEYEDDSVFCRSDPKRCDYEILKDLRRFADVAKTLPPNR